LLEDLELEELDFRIAKDGAEETTERLLDWGPGYY